MEDNRDDLIEKLRNSPSGIVINGMRACWLCNTSGKLGGEVCPRCKGEMIYSIDPIIKKLKEATAGIPSNIYSTVVEGLKACPRCYAHGEVNGEVCSLCEGKMVFPYWQMFRIELGNWDDPEEAKLMAEIALECLKF